MVLENEEQVRNDYLKRQEKDFNTQIINDNKHLKSNSQRILEIERLIRSSYEDKVLGKIPEDICISLLNNYQNEKENLESEISRINERIEKAKQNTQNVYEFIKRVKKYL